MLSLSGDLFVELSTPWWSPISDHTWTWPLGSLEYPVPSEFGIGADIDYVLGSKQLPDLKLGKVDFNSSKFMSDMMDDHAPQKSTPAEKKKGTWKGVEPKVEEPPPVKSAAPKLPAAPPKPAPKKAGAKAGKPGKAATSKQPAPRKSGEPAGKEHVLKPEVQQRWHEGLAALATFAEESKHAPYDRHHLDTVLSNVKNKYGFKVLEPRAVGDDWRIHASMNPDELSPFAFQGVHPSATDDSDVLWQESLVNAPEFGAALVQTAKEVPVRFLLVTLATDSREEARRTMHDYINRGTRPQSAKDEAIRMVDELIDAAGASRDASVIYRRAREAYQVARAANPTGGLRQVHHEQEVSKHPEIYVKDWLSRRLARMRKRLGSKKPTKNAAAIKELQKVKDPVRLGRILREWAMQQLDEATEKGEPLAEIEIRYVDPGSHAVLHRQRKADDRRAALLGPPEE